VNASSGLGPLPDFSSATWIAKTSLQASEESSCGGEVSLPALFNWQEDLPTSFSDGSGDFAAEIESVSMLYQHLDGPLSGELDLQDIEMMEPLPLLEEQEEGMAVETLVCGETLLAFGDAVSPPEPGSPDQCLRSPGEALLAAAPGDVIQAPSPPALKTDHFQARSASADVSSVCPVLPVTPSSLGDASFIDLTPSPADEFVSSENFVSSPSRIAQSPNVAAAASSPHFSHSIEDNIDMDFTILKQQEKMDEQTRFIDQALEDMKALESMCGIAPESVADAPAPQTASGTAWALREIKASDVTEAFAQLGQTPAQPKSKRKPAAASQVKTDDVLSQLTASPVSAPATVIIKEEPVIDDEEVQFVEERPAASASRRQARRRAPRVAVTPGRPVANVSPRIIASAAAAPAAAAAATATTATQIVIVLTEEQLAGIQNSGQLVLNAASLLPQVAASKAGVSKATPSKATPNKAAAVKVGVSKATPSKVARSKAVLNKPGPSKIVLSEPGPSKIVLSKPGPSKVVLSKPGPSKVVLSKPGPSKVMLSKPGSSKTVVLTKSAGASKAGTSKRARQTSESRPEPRPILIRRQKTGNKDPLAGWMQPKAPVAAASWEFPMGELSGDSSVALAEAELSFPDDLEELLLASPESVPALPADDANMLLEELISGSVRASPELFGELPGTGLAGDCADQGLSAAQALYGDQGLSGQVAPRGGGMALQPDTFNDPNSLQQQLAGETWAPALSPSEMEPWSPTGSSDSDFGLDAWSPLSETPAGRRRQARPRPYDKPEAGEGGGGRRHLTEEERRLRKKEQNKNAATRYRQKKKEEQEIVSLDQDALEGRNKELRDNVAGLTKELQYLRQLMREVIRHKHAV